jgi:hypothetical protein
MRYFAGRPDPYHEGDTEVFVFLNRRERDHFVQELPEHFCISGNMLLSFFGNPGLGVHVRMYPGTGTGCRVRYRMLDGRYTERVYETPRAARRMATILHGEVS